MGEVIVRKTESLWDQLEKMQERITRRAFDIFRSNGSNSGRDLDDWLSAERELIWRPDVELKERDNQFELRATVAGIDPKDIRVEVAGDVVLIKAETQSEKKEEKGELHITEIQTGSLFRSIRLPKRIEAAAVKADVKNGLLTISVPIAEETKARKADVRAA
jgi:HSP20 family protein